MHRWTPVSSTVPWSTSTSQEVFHVDTNLPRIEFLICTFVNKRAVVWQPKARFQLALLSQSRTLLLFLFGTPPNCGPVQALFHCSKQMPTERV